MKDLLIVEDIEQLKAMSDPLRIRLLYHMVDKAYTGQQLSEVLDIPRSKIHYHLKELEKHGLIEVTHREEKNGIMQKFYRNVARSIVPGDNLWPLMEGGIIKQSAMEMLGAVRNRILQTPDHYFDGREGTKNQQTANFIQYEFYATPEEYNEIMEKIDQLITDCNQRNQDSKNRKTYFMGRVSFETDKLKFNK